MSVQRLTSVATVPRFCTCQVMVALRAANTSSGTLITVGTRSA